MAKIELNIVALGDFSSVNNQIKALQLQIDALNKGVAGVGLGQQLTKDLNAAQAAFKSTMLSTGQFTMQTVKMASETEKFGQSLVSGKLRLSEYFNIITGKAGQATASMNALAESQIKLNNSVVVQNKQGFLDVYTPTAFNGVAQAEELVTMKAALMQKAIEGGSTALINFGKNTQWAGRQLTVGLTMPMVLFGASAVKSFKDTNTELTRLQRLYGEGLTPPSQAELDAISKQVLDLGTKIAQTMGIAQTETVKTAANFAAMGKQGQDLLNITYQAERLSKLGGVDSQAATNAIVALQNVYKINTADLATAVNFLSDVQKQTTMSLSDMTEAIPRVGPIMQQLGGTYKETAVMLLAMKEAGVPAAQSANALKSAMASIIAPTTAAKKEFQSFGISLDAIKGAGGPVQMIQALQQGLQNLTPLVREQLIEKLFGKFQFARVSALIENFGKAGSQTINALKIANATSSQLATLANQEMKQATSSASAQLARALEGIKATLYPIGQKFVEMGTIVLNVANKIGKAFSDLPSPLKGFFGFLLVGAALAGPLIMLTGLLSNFAGYILKTVGNINKLAHGGMTLKELLTPEIVASQKAAELFSNQIVNDVDAVDLLSQAIQRLTESLSGMSTAMNTGTLEEKISTAAAVAQSQLVGGRLSSGTLPSLPLINTRTQDDFARMDKAHVGISQTLSKEEAAALLPELTAVQQTRVNQALTAIETGAVKEEQILFNLLDNFVLNLSHSVNEAMKPYAQRPIYDESGNLIRAGKESKGIAREQFISQELTPSVYTSNILQAKEKGVQVTNEQIAKFSQAMNLITEDILLSDDQFKILKEPQLAAAYDQSIKKAIEVFTVMAQNGEEDAAEMLKLAQAFQELRNYTTLEITGPLSTMGIKGGGSSGATQIRGAAFPGVSTYETAGGTRAEIAAMAAEIRASGSIIDQSFADAIFAERELIVNAVNKVGEEEIKAAETIGEEVGSVAAESQITAMQIKINQMIPSLVKTTSSKLTAESSMFALPGFEAGQVYQSSMQKQIESMFPAMMQSEAEILTAESSMFAIPGEAAGDSWLSAFMTRVKGAGSAIGSTVSKVGGMGKGGAMGIALGGTILGQTLAGNKNSAVSTAGTAVTAGANAAMIASLLPEAGTPLLGGALAMPGIGVIVGGVIAATVAIKTLSKMMADAKAHNDAIAASFKASGDAISVYGGTMRSTTQAVYSFNMGTAETQKALSQTAQDVENITKLKPTDALRQIGDLLKGGTTASGIIGTVEQFAAAQVANGMDPKGVSQMVTDLLTYAGKTQYLSAALKEVTGNTKDLSTATDTWLHKLVTANGFMPIMTTDYSQLNTQQKALSDAMLSISNTLANSQTPMSTVTDLLKSMGTAAANSKDAVVALQAALINVGQAGAASNVGTWFGQGMTMADIQMMLMLGTKGSQYTAGLQDSNKQQLMASLKNDVTKYYTDQAQQSVDAAKAGLASAQSNLTKAQASAALQASTTSGLTNAQKKQLLQDNARVKALDAQLATMKLQTQELKAQQQYNLSQADLDNQIRLAQASGDFLQANLLRQQKNANTTDFNTTNQQQDLQNQKDALSQEIAGLNQIVADFKTKTQTADNLQTYKDAITLAGKGVADALKNQKNLPSTLADIFKNLGISDTNPLAVKVVADTTAGPNGKGRQYGANAFGTPPTGAKAGQTWTDPVSHLKFTFNPGIPGKGGPFWTAPDGTRLDVPNKARGGFISGPGTWTSDSIPAMLSNGEFVTNAASVAKYGTSFMNSINNGTFNPKFPTVGAPNVPTAGGAGIGGAVYNITVNAQTSANTDEIVKAVTDSIKRMDSMTSTNRRIRV